MFPGYDPDRRRPYTQEVYKTLDGKKYVVTYYVSNGYGGSISIMCGPLKLVSEEDNDEEATDGKQC